MYSGKRKRTGSFAGRLSFAASALLVLSTINIAADEAPPQILVDPPPQPSGGSRAQPSLPGPSRWIVLNPSQAPPPATLPELRRSDVEPDAHLAFAPAVTPAPIIQWDAITQSFAGASRPPDTHAAVGPGVGAAGRVVEVTNDRVQIYDKTGATIAGPTALATVFPALPSAFGFDPKVLYDQHSGRFFIVVLEVGFSGGTCTSALLSGRMHIAVSTSSTPGDFGASWTFLVGPDLILIGGTTTWADYPSIGADSDSLFVTTNQFSGTCTYLGGNIRVFSKAALLAGIYSFVDLTYDTTVTPGLGTIQPAHVYGTTDNGGFYLINRAGPTAYRIFNIMGDPAAPVATTGLYAWTGGAMPADTTADQCTLATPDPDTLATRVQNAVYRNGSLWCVATADADADPQTEVVWQEIRTNSYPTSAPTVVQSGFVNGAGTPDPWTYVPSINVNPGGDAAIVYTQSSTTQCPDHTYAMRLSTDAPGTLQAAAVARASAGPYDPVGGAARARWGDYAAMVVDPDDGCFWHASEYAATSTPAASLWGTHVAKFCTATEGACCFGATLCGNRTPADCATQGGMFRGLGTKCPTQGVVASPHLSPGPGPAVVHWVNPSVNCFNIVLDSPEGTSSCCSAHAGPGCDEPTCSASVCEVSPSCCGLGWVGACADLAHELCPGLCLGSCPPAPQAIDAWQTTSGDPTKQTCHSFGTGPESPPIPADFFGPGSEPFFGEVCYVGEPLGPTAYGDFGDANTLILRSADPFDRCDVPSPTPSTVDIQIVALNLTSTQPIQVIISGQPTQWDVRVNLSDFVNPPPGQMTATKTHCNGGTFTTTLNVQPKFTFTRVGNPLDVHVLDTGLDGYPFIQLQEPATPWVNDLDPNLKLDGAQCTGFHAGVQDPNPKLDCDCDVDQVRDDCDVDQGASDCNQNLVPDACDPDFDGDFVPDDCDNCPDAANSLQEDLDQDGFGDLCDLCPTVPEHWEGDHDGDKILDVPNLDYPVGDNCPCVSNFDQQDTNGDGIGDACEATFAGDDTGLILSKLGGDDIELLWADSCLATDDDYAVYRGSIGGLFDDHLPVVCSTGGGTTLDIASAPANSYYLVVPTSGGLIEGSYGQKTGGERPASAGQCLPQAIGSCPP